MVYLIVQKGLTIALLYKKSPVLKQIVLLGFLENLDRLLGVRLHRPDIVLIITSAAVGPAGVRTVMIVMIVMIVRIAMILMILMIMIVTTMKIVNLVISNIRSISGWRKGTRSLWRTVNSPSRSDGLPQK